MDAVNVDAVRASFAEHWSPKRIAQVNDYDVRIVKVQGEFTWHRHADTDEFFLVLDGEIPAASGSVHRSWLWRPIGFLRRRRVNSRSNVTTTACRPSA